jgi:hypothetical protein
MNADHNFLLIELQLPKTRAGTISLISFAFDCGKVLTPQGGRLRPLMFCSRSHLVF